MDEPDITTVLWRHKLTVAACVGIAVLAAIIASLVAPKVYEARATIQAGSLTDGGGVSAEGSQALARSYAEVMTSGSFFERIRPSLPGRPSVRDLQDDVDAEALPDTAVIRIKVRGDSPAAARALAAGITASFMTSLRIDATDRVRRRQAQINDVVADLTARIDDPAPGTSPGQIDQLRASRATLVREGAALVADGVSEVVGARRVGPPSASSTPVSPRPKLNIVAGIVLGFLIGSAAAWWRERRTRPLGSAEEAAVLADAPVLASVPLRRRVLPGDPVLAEAYDVLRATLLFQARDHGALRVVTVVSENARVGKSSTIEGLARATERAGGRAVLVDADMRLGELSSRLGHGDGPGLGDVLSGETDLDTALVELSPHLWLLPSRPQTPDPPSLLESARMRTVLAELGERADLVLIDSPPVAHLADGLLLSSLSDAVLMVVRPGTTSRPDLVRGMRKVRQTGATVAGLVVFTELDLDTAYYPPRTTARGRREGAATVR